MKMDWRTRLDETRAPFNFYYLTLSGSGGDVEKVLIFVFECVCQSCG